MSISKSMKNCNKFDKSLLNILACPVCKTDIKYNANTNQLICKKCRRIYPIRDGIPVMLKEEAIQN